MVLCLGCAKDNPCNYDDCMCIYIDGELCEGFGIGVNSSTNNTNWLSDMRGSLKMAYNSGQQWGAVFITYGGDPQPQPRPGLNCSKYHFIAVEMKGDVGGEEVLIGIKDNLDPDDGSEVKLSILNLTTSWQRYEFSLNQFSDVDLSHLYVVIEFVFLGNSSRTVYFRNVCYLE